MNRHHFENLTRSLTRSRRACLGGALGLSVFTWSGLVDAKKKGKKRKKKTKRNGFGCVDVGGFCKNADQCCSGICAGKKGKQTCQSHDTGGCRLADDTCLHEGPMPCPDGSLGACFQTTGRAGFCGFRVGSQCVACARDSDCVAAFGAGAACIVCASACAETNHTTCIPAEI